MAGRKLDYLDRKLYGSRDITLLVTGLKLLTVLYQKARYLIGKVAGFLRIGKRKAMLINKKSMTLRLLLTEHQHEWKETNKNLHMSYYRPLILLLIKNGF